MRISVYRQRFSVYQLRKADVSSCAFPDSCYKRGAAFTKPNSGDKQMAVFMVERDLPGISMDQLAAAQKAAIEIGEQFTADGKNVRYIRTTFVPGEAKAMCLFEAENADLVKEVNETAQIPFNRIIEAMDLTPAT
jgi:hypothetical protein